MALIDKVLRYYYERKKLSVSFRYFPARTPIIFHKPEGQPKVVYVSTNKPEKYWNADERATLNEIQQHFADAGYLVLVRY